MKNELILDIEQEDERFRQALRESFEQELLKQLQEESKKKQAEIFKKHTQKEHDMD
jgi:phosphoenolpyruvate-protein kinase (PTS system EI component)